MQPRDQAPEVVGHEALPAVAQPGPAGVGLKEVGRKIDEGVGRDPFAGVHAARHDDGVAHLGVCWADPQGMRLPTFWGPVGQRH